MSNQVKVPVVFKSFEGKPKKEQQGYALRYEEGEKVKYVTLDEIAQHVFLEGRLIFPHGFDYTAYRADKAAGKLKKGETARQMRYFMESRLFIVDIDEGIPVKGDPAAVIDWLMSKSKIMRKYAALIFPSSSYTPEVPKLHIFFVLDEPITTHEEYRDLYTRFDAVFTQETGLKTDVDAMKKVTQPLYGTVYYKWFEDGKLVEVSNEHGIQNYEPTPISTERLKTLPVVETQQEHVRRQRIEREGEKRHARAKRGARHVREVNQLVRFILDHYEGKMDNETWYRFLLVAATESGHSSEVWETIVNSEYYKRGMELWDWIPEDDEKRFYSEEADTLTIGTLYWLAYKLGYGTTNAAALQPDHVIESLNELPPDGSYLLRAFTGVGKSQAQKPTIARVLAAGKRVIWLVPTKSLARDAATALGGTVYLDEEGEIKPSEELRKTPFVVTTPQTFTTRIAPYGLKDVGLLVLDEVQQIGNAAVETNNQLWRKRKRDGIALNTLFLDAIARAVATDGLIVRGLDAGLARMAQEWLPLPVYDCVLQLEKAPVMVYEHRGAMLEALWRALRGGGLTYITSDRKDVTKELAQEIATRYPEKRVLLVNGETVDARVKEYYDPRVIDFLNDPNKEVGKYDVILTSPTMLTGVSITATEAAHVFQFCENLPPKSNLQMLNRFRRARRVYVWYGGMSAVGEVRSLEEAIERAEILREGLPYVARSEKAQTHDTLRHWTELDTLYQSFDPLAYYISLLEREGREVELVPDEGNNYRQARAKAEDEDKAWADEHWHEVEEFNPLERIKDLPRREFLARLKKREVNRKTEGGWTMSDDLKLTGRAAEEFTRYQLSLTEIATGRREVSKLNEAYALDPDTPASLLRADDKIIVLLHGLRILGYKGETTIPATVFIEHGKELVTFLEEVKRYWNAIFPSGKKLELSEDYVADARRLTKDLLSLIGLKMRRGRRVRINGTRDYDAEIVNVGELKHLLYLRACGREGTKLPDGVELVFPELAKDAHILADAEAMDWYKDQNEEVQGMVRGEIEYVGFAAAVDLVKRFIAGEVF